MYAIRSYYDVADLGEQEVVAQLVEILVEDALLLVPHGVRAAQSDGVSVE